MGWTLLDIATLPEPGDIVWCKFPLRERPGQPGPTARPALVRAVRTLQSPDDELLFGEVEVSYGTGRFTQEQCDLDLVIQDWSAVKRCGLHKPTRFALDPANRKNIIWCSEYFIPPDYIRGANLQIGRLGEAEIGRMRELLLKRGLATGQI